MAKVVVTARLPGQWEKILSGHEVVSPKEGEGDFSGERLRSALRETEALLPLLSVPVDEALLDAAPRLRIVANFAVGFDNIDVPSATARGIVVTNTPDVLTGATADLTMALLLAAARRLPEGMALAHSGTWKGMRPDQLLGLDLGGARLGLVGFGRIGRAVARRARGFGLNIAYASPRASDAEPGVRHLPLETLISESQFLSIHCPLQSSTHHLIDRAALERMPEGAVLVNSARGPIVDEEALCDVLDRGHLFAAGLDVYEHEPGISARLLSNPRVVTLPHLGSATIGTRSKMAALAAQSIVDLLAGRRPAHVVNPDALPQPLRSI